MQNNQEIESYRPQEKILQGQYSLNPSYDEKDEDENFEMLHENLNSVRGSAVKFNIRNSQLNSPKKKPKKQLTFNKELKKLCYINSTDDQEKQKKEQENEEETEEYYKMHLQRILEKTKKMQTYKFIRKHFVDRILQDVQSRRFKNLNVNHIEMIGDLSVIDYWRMQNKNQFFLFQQGNKALRTVFHELGKFVIRENNPIDPRKIQVQCLCWLEIILNFFILLSYAIRVFYVYENDTQFLPIKISTIVIFTFGSIFRINRSFYEHNELIKDKKNRLERFLHLYFKHDLIGIIAAALSLIRFPVLLERFIVLPIFIKLFTIQNLIEEQKEFLPNTTNFGYFWELCVLLIKTVMTCFFVGTLYHLLAVFEMQILEDEENWLSGIEKYDEKWYIRLSESFYWALATIMLVGSKGNTFLETIFCCITLLSTVGMFATILSKISMILEDIEQQGKNYKEDLKQLKQLFDRNKYLKPDTQSRLLNYLKYMYVGHQDQTQNQYLKQILQKFPEDLQIKVRRQMYTRYINQFRFLKENFSKECISKIINIVQEEYFMPNQQIFQDMDQEDPKLYMLIKGKAQFEQKIKGNKKKESNINEDDKIIHQRIIEADLDTDNFHVFGQKNFINDQNNKSFQCRSLDFTTILTFKRSQFVDICTERDLELLQKYKHQLRVMEKCEIVDQICNKCERVQHIHQKCNLVHYSPNYQTIVIKSNISQNCNRLQYKRQKDRGHCQNSYVWHYAIMKSRKEILESNDLRIQLRNLQMILKESEITVKRLFQRKKKQQQLDNQQSDDQEIDEEQMLHKEEEMQKKIQNQKKRHTFINKSKQATQEILTPKQNEVGDFKSLTVQDFNPDELKNDSNDEDAESLDLSLSDIPVSLYKNNDKQTSTSSSSEEEISNLQNSQISGNQNQQEGHFVNQKEMVQFVVNLMQAHHNQSNLYAESPRLKNNSNLQTPQKHGRDVKFQGTIINNSSFKQKNTNLEQKIHKKITFNQAGHKIINERRNSIRQQINSDIKEKQQLYKQQFDHKLARIQRREIRQINRQYNFFIQFEKKCEFRAFFPENNFSEVLLKQKQRERKQQAIDLINKNNPLNQMNRNSKLNSAANFANGIKKRYKKNGSSNDNADQSQSKQKISKSNINLKV